MAPDNKRASSVRQPKNTVVKKSSSLGLYIALLVFAILGAYFIYVRPARASLQTNTANQNAQKALIVSERQQIAALTSKSSSLSSSIHQSYSYFQTLVPSSSASQTNLVTLIPQQIANAGLTIQSFASATQAAATNTIPISGAPQTQSSSSSLGTPTTFTLTVKSATFGAIENWLHAVTTGTPIATVQSGILNYVSSFNGSGAAYTFSCTLTYYSSPQSTASTPSTGASSSSASNASALAGATQASPGTSSPAQSTSTTIPPG